MAVEWLKCEARTLHNKLKTKEEEKIEKGQR
jgi:hypothetical protein